MVITVYLVKSYLITCGKLLHVKQAVVRFVETFRTPTSQDDPQSLVVELWLVFRYVGKSLDALLYNPLSSQESVIWEPSSFWRATLTSKDGPFIIR